MSSKIKKIDYIEDLLPELLRIRPWLLPALAVDPTNPDEMDIVAELEDRTMYLWVSETAFTICSFHETDTGEKFCFYRYTGGATNDALETIIGGQTEVEEWAKKYGYNIMVAAGRKGWGRVLGKHGFKPVEQKYAGNRYVFAKHLT